MATITPSYPAAPHSRTRLVQWALTDDDTGVPWTGGPFKDMSVQYAGTWSTATLVWEGSNDGTNWVTLTDAAGVALSFTADGLKEVLAHCAQVRPVTSGGGGATITATLAASS